MGEGNQTNRDERNIMILFLSNFLFDDLNQKRTTNGEKPKPKNTLKQPANYRITRMNNGIEEIIEPACIQTNEAPIKDILFNLDEKPLDAVFCFVTDKVANSPVSLWKDVDTTEATEYENQVNLFWDRLESINKDENLKGILKTPLTKETFHTIPFNESALDPSLECVHAAIKLEDKIKEYIRNEKDKDGKNLTMKDCHLFADITGGMRTANMTLSAAIQLLQYDGAHLDRVVYSDFAQNRPLNPVSNVQPITDLYMLVAGVFAFNQYGRSEALKDYFKGETFAPLLKLRNVMDEFSEAMQLCQESVFEDKLNNLITTLETFSKAAKDEPNKSTKVELFANMAPNLHDIYSNLLLKGKDGNYLKDNDGRYKTDRIEILRWCVKNKLLQQAVTFCTEWLPEYLINHGVVYVDDAGIQSYLAKQKGLAENDPVGKDSFMRKFFSDESIKIDQIHSKSHKTLINNLIDGKQVDNDLKDENLNEFIKDFKTFLDSINNDLPIVKLQMKSNSKSVKNIKLKRVVNELINPSDGKGGGMKLENIKPKNILHKLNEWTKDLDKWYREDLFKLPQDPYTKENVTFITDDQSGNARKRAKALFNVNLVSTDLTNREDAIFYVEEYTYIRTKLRNKINHADGSKNNNDGRIKKMTVEEIVDYLMGYIDALEKLKDNPRPNFTGLWVEEKTWKKPQETTP